MGQRLAGGAARGRGAVVDVNRRDCDGSTRMTASAPAARYVAILSSTSRRTVVGDRISTATVGVPSGTWIPRHPRPQARHVVGKVGDVRAPAAGRRRRTEQPKAPTRRDAAMTARSDQSGQLHCDEALRRGMVVGGTHFCSGRPRTHSVSGFVSGTSISRSDRCHVNLSTHPHPKQYRTARHIRRASVQFLFRTDALAAGGFERRFRASIFRTARSSGGFERWFRAFNFLLGPSAASGRG